MNTDKATDLKPAPVTAASYTPESKFYADRLVLDYNRMRALAKTPDAANWWLATKIAQLHTRAAK